MCTSCSVIDYKNDKKIFLVFVESDFAEISELWNKRNSFNQELRNFTEISHNKMSSLSLNDWKLSIIAILELVLNLNYADQIDIENIKTKCMHDILLGFSHKHNLATGNILDYLQIHKIKDGEYSFILTSSDLMLEVGSHNET